MSEITWGDLTAEEQNALRKVADSKYPDGMSYRVWGVLDTYGLLISDTNRENVRLSPEGRAVLAQASKPTMITAADFVAHDYAAKIAAGECIVTITDSPKDTIKAIELAPEFGEGLYRFFWSDIAITGISDGKKLRVTWLPQPAAETETTTAPIDYANISPEEFGQQLAAKHMNTINNTIKDWRSEVEIVKATESETTTVEGEGVAQVDYQDMWFSAAKQLAELRVDYDELYKELENTPPQFTLDEQRNEIETLRAELATVKAEQDAALKQIKALKRKSGLDDGFIDFLTTKDGNDE